VRLRPNETYFAAALRAVAADGTPLKAAYVLSLKSEVDVNCATVVFSVAEGFEGLRVRAQLRHPGAAADAAGPSRPEIPGPICRFAE
jgi:hypothetical protein